jgi:ATP-dependent helicase/DNAse subunit B
MTARVSILGGPAGAGKTRHLLERHRAVAGSGPPGAALWLCPSHRAALALRSRLGGVLCPGLFTFQDLAEEVLRVNDPSARPLSHVQRRLLAEELIAGLHARGRLPHFQGVIDTRGFAAAVFALLGELKQNEIWPEKLEAALARLPGRAQERPGGRKEEQCALLYRAYHDRLVRHGLYDLEGRLGYARDLLARGKREPLAGVRAVFVDGFSGFLRTQLDILTALAGWVEEMWITLPDEPGPERAELFAPSRQALAALAGLRPSVSYLGAELAGERRALCPPAGPPAQGRRLADRILGAVDNPQAASEGRSAGLAHLERELFRPRKLVRRAADAAGLLCLEAPGPVGEARMVAREIRQLLQGGARPDDVLVVLREVTAHADLLTEVFAEYGIPADVEGAEPLARNPAVATLLRVHRLPEEGWPFAAVTALLRSGYFRPDWPEVQGCPEMPGLAEALLRLLGEPRGRDAYLGAVKRWHEDPPPGLEDEDAEESRRTRTHELAARCRGFLERFFRSWDGAPQRAPLAEHAGWLRGLADDLGLRRAAAGSPRDAAALARFWDELARWERLDRTLHGKARTLDRAHFQRTLAALAAEAGLARTPRGPGRVRVLSAGLARALDAPYVFLMGLGERSFPRLTPPEPLLDEQERQALKQAGLDIPCAGDLLPAEKLLFYEVVTAARERLVLSYPAVDEQGQTLLPCAFLAELRECFAEGAITRKRRQMLIQGYDSDEPLSPAEHRVQLALQMAGRPVSGSSETSARPAPVCDGPLTELLTTARDVARRRLLLEEHGPYDGLLRDPAVVAEVCQAFGPDHILSPTALEAYIACPFRFFLRHVLHLEPLEEPSEEIESTERGLAFHRALSRLHTQLKAQGVHEPAEEVVAHLAGQLEQAVRECTHHASPAARALWRLEGQRLQRAAERYAGHWRKLVEPWLPHQVRPRPEYFEVSFGLPAKDGTLGAGPLILTVDGLEVRVSGRIDRVDVAELPDGGVGFWVIDYKTGRSTHYTAGDLKEFRRLQLTLYALAVEEVLLAGRLARPLGLAYWLVTDTGPKPVLPGHPRHLEWLARAEGWRRVREELRRWVVRLVRAIRGGDFPLKPRSEDCTQTCDFGQVCRISQSRRAVEEKAWTLPLPMMDSPQRHKEHQEDTKEA